MKRIPFQLVSATFVWLMLMTTNIVLSQTVVTHIISPLNSDGVIIDLGAETITIRSEASPLPVSYEYSRKTLYVDETGAPISIKTVTVGLSVTVYYAKVGEKLRAAKVIVRKLPVAPPAPVTKQ